MSLPTPANWAFSPVLPDRGRFAIIGASFGAVRVKVAQLREARDPLAKWCEVRRGRNGGIESRRSGSAKRARALIDDCVHDVRSADMIAGYSVSISACQWS